jgi:hypothetical protein
MANEFSRRHINGCVNRNNYLLDSDLYRNAEVIILASAYFSLSQFFDILAPNVTKLSHKKPIILTDIPRIKFSKISNLTNEDRIYQLMERGEYRVARNKVTMNDVFIDRAKEYLSDITVIDTEQLFCDETNCYLAAGNLPIYRGDTHMAAAYSLSMAGWLQEHFAPHVGQNEER